MEFEIYYSDLTSEAQQRMCKEWGTTEEEENWDVSPLAIVERKQEESAGEYPCDTGCSDKNLSDNRCINEDICTAWEIYQEAL